MSLKFDAEKEDNHSNRTINSKCFNIFQILQVLDTKKKTVLENRGVRGREVWCVCVLGGGGVGGVGAAQSGRMMNEDVCVDRFRILGGTNLQGSISEIRILDQSRGGEVAARGWRGPRPRLPAGTVTPRESRPTFTRPMPTESPEGQAGHHHVHPVHGRTWTWLERQEARPRRRGYAVAGWTRGSPLRSAGAWSCGCPSVAGAGPRRAVRGPLPTVSARGLRRRRRQWRSGAGVGELKGCRAGATQGGGDASGTPRDHPGLARAPEDTAPWLLRGRQRSPPRACGAARPRLSRGRFAATSAGLCLPMPPPASRLHDNRAPIKPRPAPSAPRLEGSGLTSPRGGAYRRPCPIRRRR